MPHADTRPQTPGMAERTSAPPAWPCVSRALTSEKARTRRRSGRPARKPMRPGANPTPMTGRAPEPGAEHPFGTPSKRSFDGGAAIRTAARVRQAHRMPSRKVSASAGWQGASRGRGRYEAAGPLVVLAVSENVVFVLAAKVALGCLPFPGRHAVRTGGAMPLHFWDGPLAASSAGSGEVQAQLSVCGRRSLHCAWLTGACALL